MSRRREDAIIAVFHRPLCTGIPTDESFARGSLSVGIKSGSRSNYEAPSACRKRLIAGPNQRRAP
jgi:hypothetical protein